MFHCCLVFFFSSWWLQIPKVFGALESYVKIRTDIEQLRMTAKDLKNLISQSNRENNDKFEKAREVCRSLRDYYSEIEGQNFQRLSGIYYFPFSRGDITLSDLYKQRNITLLSILLLILVAGVVLFFTSILKKTYSCVIPSDESAISGEYKCVEKFPELTYGLWLGFFVGVVAEIYFAYRGLKETRGKHCNKYNNEFLNFTEILWMNSRSKNSNFEGICCFMCCCFMLSEADKSLREKLLDQCKPNSTDTTEESRPTRVINDTRIPIPSSTESSPTSQTTESHTPAEVFRFSRPPSPVSALTTKADAEEESEAETAIVSIGVIIDASASTHSVYRASDAAILRDGNSTSDMGIVLSN